MLLIKLTRCNSQDLRAMHGLAQLLAQYFPQPQQVMGAIYELLLNALEHGVLGFSFDEKTALLQQGRWHEEVTRRLSEPSRDDRAIDILLHQSEQGYELRIRDGGPGFLWADFSQREIPPDHPNGRGLQIVRQAGFDDFTFNQAGNAVVCRVRGANLTAA